MKKVVLIPDSFKGSMSSPQICAIIKNEIANIFPRAQVLSLPVADGGEGSTEAFLQAVGGQKILLPITGPYGEEITGFYGLLPDGTAVVEMAAAAGLPLAGDHCRAEKTSTYGVGLLIADAVRRGCKEIILGLGGSATNDGGCGCACALGARFLDAAGAAFIPTGESLHRIAKIDLSGLSLGNVKITAMCDIDNPLCGSRGAAQVFAPQKGADAEMCALLDRGLAHLDRQIARDLGKSVADLPGAGAAGGMGAGCVAFFDAELKSGIETVLDAVGFDTALQGADLVITGEGKLDNQSLGGKVVAGVAGRMRGKKIPLVVLTGTAAGDIEPIYDRGVTAVFSICRGVTDLPTAMEKGPENLALTARNLLLFAAALTAR